MENRDERVISYYPVNEKESPEFLHDYTHKTLLASNNSRIESPPAL